MTVQEPDMARYSGQRIFLVSVIVGSCLAVGFLFLTQQSQVDPDATVSRLSLRDIPFNGDRAYQYLQQICDLGPRPSGTPSMEKQQEMLVRHFTDLGASVEKQQFRVRHPQTGEPVTLTNLIVSWHPEKKDRVVLAAHYDTRPYPDRDRVNPRGVFIGANDGASGVALLMELGHMMPDHRGPLGVDFVLFDAEEFIFDDSRDRYFLGSEYFAHDYINTPRDYRYRWGVLLDMVADADLQLFQERNSMSWPDTRPLVRDIWDTARKLGVYEFIPRTKHDIRDDHLAMRNIAKIPTCDIIDFDYPYWHTQQDTADKCSALSLAKVGWVINTWLQQAR